jgi:adenylosuccinate lyase
MYYGMTEEEINAVLDPALYTGRCAEQVERYIATIKPLIDSAPEGTASIEI